LFELVPKKLFLTKGKGIHEDRLTSFEYALRDAGIAGTNLVLISSIFPPEAKFVSRSEGLKLIKPGQKSRIQTDIHNVFYQLDEQFQQKMQSIYVVHLFGFSNKL